MRRRTFHAPNAATRRSNRQQRCGSGRAAWCLLLLAALGSVLGCGQRRSLEAIATWEPPALAHATNPAQSIEFFESQIRPTLTQHCAGCHGPTKQSGGLRLDSRDHLLQGGATGPVVILGDPARSKLVAAMRHDGDVQMPPPGKLADETIAAFAEWVRVGAPWPDSASGSMSPSSPASIDAARKNHWAFQSVRPMPIPAVADNAWPATPIDRFILAKLEARNMAGSRRADPYQLARRLSFDLVGLPPSPDDLAAFTAAPNPDAFAKLVDRLLDSPQFGEKWARHWLDVARYADTKGYVYDGENRRYLFAYTYRDYVVRAFNDDLPYDRFLMQQIAGDRLPAEPTQESLAALGFLTLGRRFANNVHDLIDDRLDVIFRGTQGLTVTCARCHDHKLEPIPTRDYYSLYGVLAGNVESLKPIGPPPAATPEYEGYLSELSRRVAERDRLLEWNRQRLCDRLRGKVTEYLLGVLDAENQPGDDFYVVLAPDDINPTIVRRWHSYLLQHRDAHDPIFGPWNRFAALPADNFETLAAGVTRDIMHPAQDAPTLNPLVAELFSGRAPKSMHDVAARYGRLLQSVHESWSRQLKYAAARELVPPQSLDDPANEQLRQVLYAPDAPTSVPVAAIHQIEAYFNEDARLALHRAQAEVDRLRGESPAAPRHAHALEDAPTPFSPHVFIQGNPKLKGDTIPRQFLEVLAGPDRKPFQHGSGRLELAQHIAHPDNPLTARVMVNRIWRQLFGTGLVESPSNFGVSGERPSHPELLDYLARRFMDDGWSVKKLLRLIVLSSVYQQSSDDQPEFARRDPDNRWLWKMNRRALDFEAIRDSMIAVAGRLDLTIGGRSTALVDSPRGTRRTIYSEVDRQNLAGVLRTFDFANPDTHNSARHRTTVPQQALFLLNSPFVIEVANDLIGQVDAAAESNDTARIERLYQLVYQRAPTAREVALARSFLGIAAAPGELACTGDESEPSTACSWSHLAQVLLMANEFVFID